MRDDDEPIKSATPAPTAVSQAVSSKSPREIKKSGKAQRAIAIFVTAIARRLLAPAVSERFICKEPEAYRVAVPAAHRNTNGVIAVKLDPGGMCPPD